MQLIIVLFYITSVSGDDKSSVQFCSKPHVWYGTNNSRCGHFFLGEEFDLHLVLSAKIFKNSKADTND